MSASRICSSSGSNGTTDRLELARPGGAGASSSTTSHRGASSRERPSSRRRTSRSRRPIASTRLDVDDEELLREARRSGDHLAGVVEDDRVAVEDELVLAADEVAEREVRARVAGARHEHLLPLLGLADVERRGREVDDQLRAREREVGRRRPGLPDVLADREPDGRLSEPKQDELAPLGEVAVLVEDAVVREEVLAVDGPHPSVRADGARVREIAVEPRRPDERDEPSVSARDRLERLVCSADEAGSEEEILGRIAGRRELREDDEIGAGVARLAETAKDLRAVARRGRRRRSRAARARSSRFSPHSHKPQSN